MKVDWQPYLVGVVLGLIMLLGGFVSTVWFPWLWDESYKWAQFLFVGVLVGIGVLLARYWDFLGTLRLWLTLLVLILLNVSGAFVFSGYLRKLSLWDLDFILGFEAVPAVFFLDWFLDRKAKKKRHHPLTDSVASKR